MCANVFIVIFKTRFRNLSSHSTVVVILILHHVLLYVHIRQSVLSIPEGLPPRLFKFPGIMFKDILKVAIRYNRWCDGKQRTSSEQCQIFGLQLPTKPHRSTDWQMALRRDNVISITLRQIYSCQLFKSDPLLFNQVATQSSSRGWVDPVPDIIHI